MKQHEFMVRRDFRRLALIIAAGILAGPLVTIGIRRALDLPPTIGAAMVAIVIPIAALVIIGVYWARLRIDDRGIARRILFGWTEWTWEDFACGRMERGSLPHQYVRVPSRLSEPSLVLYFFGDDAVAVCGQAIEERIRPAPIPVPGEVLFRYPRFLPIKTEARMDASGIRLTRRGKKDFFPWEAVRRVEVEAMTTKHRDFLRLTIELPTRKIALRTDLPYAGPPPKVIRAFLERSVPPDRWVVAPRQGIPDTRAGMELERQRIAKERRQTKRSVKIVAGMVVIGMAISLWSDWDEQHLAIQIGLVVFVLALLAVTLIPTLVITEKTYSARNKELDEAEGRLNSNAVASGPEKRPSF